MLATITSSQHCQGIEPKRVHKKWKRLQDRATWFTFSRSKEWKQTRLVLQSHPLKKLRNWTPARHHKIMKEIAKPSHLVYAFPIKMRKNKPSKPEVQSRPHNEPRNWTSSSSTKNERDCKPSDLVCVFPNQTPLLFIPSFSTSQGMEPQLVHKKMREIAKPSHLVCVFPIKMRKNKPARIFWYPIRSTSQGIEPQLVHNFSTSQGIEPQSVHKK